MPAEINPWKPERPTSKGAAAYHDAVSNAKYYTEILDELIKIFEQKINEDDIVVDFGAGTGVSAVRLLEHVKKNFELWLVDNSAAWLGKAYEVLKDKKNVKCFLLEKTDAGYATLADTIGRNKADHVISANTFHLVSDAEGAFIGINGALKEKGTFTIQSGNITRDSRPEGALMVDDTVKRVHGIALDIVRNDPKFNSYKKNLDERIKLNESQRKFVFPEPRPIEFYLDALKKAGFEYQEPVFKLFKVNYSDWQNFLMVRRLQAGILPEIGGHEPTPKEETDRDELITLATNKLFKELQKSNPLANASSFTIEVVYVSSVKKGTGKKLILSGKTALVTGASRGIGRAIAIEFADNGANVIINYNRNEKGALEVLNGIKAKTKCLALKADVSNPDEVRKMFEIVKERYGFIDILVNNAGIVMDKTLQNMERSEWDIVIKTNLTSAYNVTKNALSILSNNGRIINMSSIVALDGNFGQTNYAASKAGIIGFTKSLAKEVSRKGITANVIAPGLIETDILKSIPPARRKEFAERIPLGRVGTPEDVAKLALFLASEKASYITGEVIAINGGLHF